MFIESLFDSVDFLNASICGMRPEDTCWDVNKRRRYAAYLKREEMKSIKRKKQITKEAKENFKKIMRKIK